MIDLPWQPEKETPHQVIACVNFGWGLGGYADGFYHGAEALLTAIKKSTHGQDFLVYPLVYCLRHSVELSLKHLIRAGRDLADEGSDFPDSHSLGNLWTVCSPLLRKIWPKDPVYRQVHSTVTALAVIDPLGEGFRYPVTTKKQGNRSKTLNSDLRRLDLQKLFDDVSETLVYLGGAASGLSELLDHKAEMNAAFEI